ncbi:SH3 domain-containing protein [Leptolyngbya sp. FACHB-16]|uniref:SH3 domain-containing protein n=1 Tax=unclassified Leptolyngbya TaxID=2650499 RepID=UPI001686D709|nr:SH3 domain-containing protein [Leptolyngbya sp. FACHB-16]MBD2154278.1 SH3 domain-containing protein [Leptolyngbya sp. FACHB-16]
MISKLSRLSLMVALLLGCLGQVPTVAAPATVQTRDARAWVNVRTNPSTSASVAYMGRGGDRIETLRETRGNDGFTWHYVRFESGAEGWLQGDLIRHLASNPGSTIQSGIYWVGPQGMGLRVEGSRYQSYDEEGAQPWRPISELRAVREGVVFDGSQYWCLSTLPMPRSGLATCTASGWVQAGR